jgi:superfamily I DNA and/or RNA helicase
MYLFSPEKITKSAHAAYDGQDIAFFSDRLNDRQKEAVKKALVSDSVFLLQGPPGTGKTEVIAEITAQFARMGKRILISSETHKAIDNVFDRLPKKSCIRPLRLIPSHSNKSKDNNYAPENLVDNFYTNISYSLEKEIRRFERYAEDKDTFEQKLSRLKLEVEKLEKNRSAIQDMKRRIKSIEQQLKSYNELITKENNNLRDMQEQKEELALAASKIENLNIRDGDDDAKMEQFKNELKNCLKQFPRIVQNVDKVGAIYRADIAALRREIDTRGANPELVRLEQQHAAIREKMASLRDEYTDEILPGKEREYSDLQREFIKLGKQLQAGKQTTPDDFSDSLLSKLIVKEKITPEVLRDIPGQIKELQRRIADIKEKHSIVVVKEQNDLDEKIAKQNDRISELEKNVRQKRAQIEEEKENCGDEDFQKREMSLKINITQFFKEYGITADFTGVADALSQMKIEWEKITREYARQDAANAANKENLPMYRKIVKYLRSGVPLEDDRNHYTRDLFDNVNVFGMTSTSSNAFSSKHIEDFERYGIPGLDIKQQSIDVVIIDEVSKSAFPDLLIPVLYGKTVILVGDHRQLPPVYDLKHLHGDDFTGLDPAVIDKEKNKEFMEMYENSFFKQLIYRVPEHLRVRLNKQYRCHEDIMRVFNHFYLNKNRKGDLELGMANQNIQKQHGISVISPCGLPFIEPDKHIYLVDCSDSYENFAEGNTSATNKTEAEVIARLAESIDFTCGNLTVKPRLDSEKKLDERPSMGVICTYGAQVRIIRNMLKNRIKNVNQLREERFTVSTVDDFQGDERDIIFVSMVRNPPPNKRAATRADFIKQFERINVAFSRARKLLIIAASREFFSDITFDLPDMDGQRNLDNKNYPV